MHDIHLAILPPFTAISDPPRTGRSTAFGGASPPGSPISLNRSKPFVLRFFGFKLFHAGFNLLQDLSGLRSTIGEQFFGLLILRIQRESLQRGLSTFQRSHTRLDLGRYGHVDHPVLL
jgi:hypothetical protein